MSDPSPQADLPSGGWAGRVALVAALIAIFMCSFAVSSVTTALPIMSAHLRASYSAAQWLVTAYLLAVSSILVIAGRLSDAVGKRRLFLAGAGLFTLASTGAAYAHAVSALVMWRVLQGLGSGILLAVVMPIVRELSAPASLPLHVGLVGGMSSVGTASGPAGGGAVAQLWGWQAIFFANLPLGLAVFVLGWRYLPRGGRSVEGARGFDYLGSILLVVTISSLVLALKAVGRANEHGVAYLALALVAGFGCSRAIAAAERPVVETKSIVGSHLLVDFLSSFLVACVIMTSLVAGPYYLTGGLGLSISRAGLVLAASPVAVAMTSICASWAVRRWGAERTCLAGLGIQGFGCVGMAGLSLSWGVGGFLAWLLVMAAGYGVFASSNNSAVMQKASPANAGQISGLLYLSRNLGLLFGAALMSGVFAWGAQTGRFHRVAPELNLRGLNACYLVGAVLIAMALTARLRRWTLIFLPIRRAKSAQGTAGTHLARHSKDQ